MLRKLMKHELRATLRVMGPVLGLTLLSAVGANIAVYNLVEAQSGLLNLLGVFLLMVFVAALISGFIASFVLMIVRFYKNLLRDEGYLMMTLPVTVHAHVLSKLFVSLIWAAATVITMGAAMCILVFRLEFVDLILRDFGELLAGVQFSGVKFLDFTGHALLMLFEVILLLIAADSCLCLQLYAAMAVGHSFTSHKGLLSVAAWFALSLGWSAVQNGAAYVFGRLAPHGVSLGLENLSALAAAHITLLGMTAVILIPAGIWYAMTTWFLRNRLNLG